MLKQLIAIVAFATISLVFTCDANAHGWNLFNCQHQRYERAIYNANLIAYKQRYTEAWVAGYQRARQATNGRPIYIYRTDPSRRVYQIVPPSSPARTVIRSY